MEVMDAPPVPQDLPPIAILLAEGVRCNLGSLRELCFTAVEGAGPGVVNLMQAQLESAVLTAQQRKWVKRALSLAATEDTGELRSHRLTAMRRAVLAGICHPKQPPYAAAMAALPDLSNNPAEVVIREILLQGTEHPRSKALMDALVQSGLVLTPLQEETLAAAKAIGDLPRDLARAFGVTESVAGSLGVKEPSN